MRMTPLVLTIAIGLGLGLPANDAANAASGRAEAVKSLKINTYIVTFEEAPLASFTGSDGKKLGGMPKMSATSPSATGESKFNIKSAASQNYRKYLAKERKARLELASIKLGRTLTPTFIYDVVTHGFAAPMTEAEAAKLRTIPGVKRVQQEVIRRLMTDRGPAWIKADQVWAGGGTPNIVGNKGTNMVIGVIDSGINRTHPSFAAGPVTAGATFAESFTITNPRGSTKYGNCVVNPANCNGKIIGLWDFTASGSGTTTDAPDTNGHGTHTAGTAAGNPIKITIPGGATPYTPTMSGVAPRANIIAYKACNATGCPGSMTLASINQSVVDGVNVISYSIGGGPSDPYIGFATPAVDDDGEAFLAARAAGIVSSVAAGNDGPSSGTVGSPSNAPWVMSVAATTHDRALVRPLVLSGGNAPLPGGGTLFGAGSASGTLAATLITKDANFPLCATGSNSDDGATGVSRPAAWSPTFFQSRLVACQRGFYARVAKAVNVEQGGGVGMILYNQQEEGDSVISASYVIPTVHLSYADGQAFLNWLNAGTGHTGQIQAANWLNVASSGDKLASFSGRGPVIPEGIIKPDISAPGVDIFATGLGAGGICTTDSATGANCAASLSGTSMATPHVTGAVALIKAVNPSWTPNQIISALVLTARPTVTVNGVIGTPHEVGAGQTDVSKAVRAGLFLPVTDAQFKATNASNTNTLNLPTLGNNNCFESCVLPRTFTDMVGGGGYTVVSSLPAGATMTPSASSLTFTSGQTQTVNFTFNVNNPALTGGWVYGSVTLQNNTPANGRPNLTLPVAIYASAFSNPATAPTSIDIPATTERGFFDYTFSGTAALPNARFVAGDLVVPKVSTPSLAQDPTVADPFDGLTTGIFTDTFTIPASPGTGPVVYKIKINISSLTATDADLFVGTGSTPSGATQTCSSTSGTATEVCEFEVTTSSSPQTYWLLVQNYAAGNSPPDVVTVESFQAPVQAGTTGSLVATGPGKLASGATYKVRIGWDDPSFVAGQKRIGYLMVQSTNGHTAFRLPVNLTRTGTTFEPYALSNNVARSVTLPAGSTHNKLYFDVPSNATSVTFTSTGVSGSVSLGAVRLASPVGPTIEAAPGANTFTANSAGANQTITIAGGSLQPGRWYLKPNNTGGAAATVSVNAVINTSSVAPTLKAGSYFNSTRGGHGLFVYPSGTQLAVIWFTYLEDGTPTWYYMQGLQPGANNEWTGKLSRAAWNGTSNFLTPIGKAIITITSANTFNFQYNMDGQTGSEPMQAFLTGCPNVSGNNLDVSAHWFNPAQPGFGYSVQVATNYEFIASFVYDGIGVPRFLVSERGGAFNAASTTIDVKQLSGFCPLCVRNASPVKTTVGTTTRVYGANTISSIGVNGTFIGGVPGTWNLSSPVTPLGGVQGCTP